VDTIQKPLSDLRNVLQKPHKAFQGFGSGFTELHAKLDADTLLNFAIRCGQNETQSRKSTLTVWEFSDTPRISSLLGIQAQVIQA
jgi:hypothetical protein